jgi:hypothetical protein
LVSTILTISLASDLDATRTNGSTKIQIYLRQRIEEGDDSGR